LGGVLSGTGSLTKTGTGTYSGSTTVSAGTLQIGNGGASGSVTGNIVNNNALVLNRSDAIDYSGRISGTGSLTREGTGVLTLTGNNIYTGATNINRGELSLQGSLATSAVTVGTTNPGTALNIYKNGASPSSIAGNLNAAGGNLNFYLPTTVAANDILLNVGGTANINNANVDLKGNIASLRSLQLGERLFLINGTTTGTVATTGYTDTTSEPGVTHGYSFGYGSLYLYHSSIITGGNWNPGDTDYTVSSLYGDVTLQVSGALQGVNTLTLDKTVSGDLTVDIGTLDARNNDLTVAAWSGSTGVRFDTLNLGGGHTFAITGAGAYTGFNTYNIYGGATPATYTGNLNAAGTALNFYVPSTMGAGGTMLTVGGTADITGSTVNVGINGASSPLAKGDTLTLIDATGTLTGTPTNTTANGSGMAGVTLKYEFDLTTDSNRLLATVSDSGPTMNEQTKALSEGFLGGMALVNRGAPQWLDNREQFLSLPFPLSGCL
jgi:autotransporter-associated beta strand protein